MLHRFGLLGKEHDLVKVDFGIFIQRFVELLLVVVLGDEIAEELESVLIVKPHELHEVEEHRLDYLLLGGVGVLKHIVNYLLYHSFLLFSKS